MKARHSPRPADGPGRLRRRAVLLVLGALVVTASLASLFSDRGYLEVRHYQAQRQELVEEIQKLEEEVRRLHREILDLREDPQAMERLAREELILARPGEVLFLYPRAEPSIEEAGRADESGLTASEGQREEGGEALQGHLTGDPPLSIIGPDSRRGVEQSGSSSGS